MSLPIWVEQAWGPLLGYTPEVLFLTKGWFGIICNSPEDASLLLARRWVIGGGSLMIKRWRVAFDPVTEYFQHRHLWVLLPGLPLHFWNEGALQAIGNSLGNFISVDKSSLSAASRKVGKVLVEMDIHFGLPEVMEIEWRGRQVLQRLDYLGLPFRCSFCRSTGHLRRDCKGFLVEEEESEDTLCKEIHRTLPRKLVTLVSAPFHFPQEDSSQSESSGSLTGKLKNHCPALYSSLSC
jgi:hypothetical protein